MDVPGTASLILRKTYADLSLPGALMDRAHAWLQHTDARWREKEKTWTFPGGSKLSFGYIETENDKYRYASSEFQNISFDELTHFPNEKTYTFLFSRLRKTIDIDVPLRMRAGSNPGGPGHVWVRKRFITDGRKNGRIFIPAGVRDNPYLDLDEYLASLSNLDSVTLQQLLEGNWEVTDGGGKFLKEWFESEENPALLRPNVPPLVKLCRFWDLASTEVSSDNPDPDWTAGALVGATEPTLRPNGQWLADYYILDVRRMRGNPGEVEKFVLATAKQDGLAIPIRFEQERGGAGKGLIYHYRVDVLPEYDVRGRQVTGDKLLRKNDFAAVAEQGRFHICRGKWNDDFLAEIDLVGQPGVHDDMADAVDGAYREVKYKEFSMSSSGAVQNGATDQAPVETPKEELPIERQFLPADGGLFLPRWLT